MILWTPPIEFESTTTSVWHKNMLVSKVGVLVAIYSFLSSLFAQHQKMLSLNPYYVIRGETELAFASFSMDKPRMSSVEAVQISTTILVRPWQSKG